MERAGNSSADASTGARTGSGSTYLSSTTFTERLQPSTVVRAAGSTSGRRPASTTSTREQCDRGCSPPPGVEPPTGRTMRAVRSGYPAPHEAPFSGAANRAQARRRRDRVRRSAPTGAAAEPNARGNGPTYSRAIHHSPPGRPETEVRTRGGPWYSRAGSGAANRAHRATAGPRGRACAASRPRRWPTASSDGGSGPDMSAPPSASRRPIFTGLLRRNETVEGRGPRTPPVHDPCHAARSRPRDSQAESRAENQERADITQRKRTRTATGIRIQGKEPPRTGTRAGSRIIHSNSFRNFGSRRCLSRVSSFSYSARGTRSARAEQMSNIALGSHFSLRRARRPPLATGFPRRRPSIVPPAARRRRIIAHDAPRLQEHAEGHINSTQSARKTIRSLLFFGFDAWFTPPFSRQFSVAAFLVPELQQYAHRCRKDPGAGRHPALRGSGSHQPSPAAYALALNDPDPGVAIEQPCPSYISRYPAARRIPITVRFHVAPDRHWFETTDGHQLRLIREHICTHQTNSLSSLSLSSDGSAASRSPAANSPGFGWRHRFCRSSTSPER